MDLRWRACCAEPQLWSLLSFPSSMNCRPDSCHSKQDFFGLFLSHIQNPVVQNQLHSSFIIFTLIYMFQSILHVLHDLALYDVLATIYMLII